MIARFDTSGGSNPSKGGSNTLIYLVALAVGGYLVYTYFIKPEMDKKKTEQGK